jgi:hypothetical protein
MHPALPRASAAVAAMDKILAVSCISGFYTT